MTYLAYGKSTRVLKKTEYGIIVLFSATSKVDIQSDPDSKRIKLEEPEKIVLCGILCDEITSPFLNFNLRIQFQKGDLYKVTAINHFYPDFDRLTSSAIRKSLLDTEYFGRGNYAKTSMKEELGDLLKFGHKHVFESRTEIESLIGTRYKELHSYIFKNVFRGSHYLELLEIYGSEIKDIPERYLDLLEIILIGEVFVPLEDLEDLLCSVSINNDLWDTLSRRLDPDVLESPRVELARSSYQILQKLTGSNPWYSWHIPGEGLREYLSTRPGIKILKVEGLHHALLDQVANPMLETISLLKGFRDLNLIEVEYDTDHDISPGYFDWIRTQFGSKYDSFAILYTLDKRKYYLGSKTGLLAISLEELKRRQPPLTDLLVDRCHVLNFDALRRILSEIDTTTRVYLAGSLFCYPDNTKINIFNEIYISGLRAIRLRTSTELPEDHKIQGYFPSLQSATAVLKLPYSIFTKSLNRKRGLKEKCPKFCNDDIRYSMPSQDKLIIYLESSMNMHDIAKYFMCATVKSKSIYIVGTRPKFLEVCKKRITHPSLFLGLLNK